MHETLEAHEHEHNSELMPVSLTMSILAVLVAGVTLLGHRAHTEELLQQVRATDQWAFYQAKTFAGTISRCSEICFPSSELTTRSG